MSQQTTSLAMVYILQKSLTKFGQKILQSFWFGKMWWIKQLDFLFFANFFVQTDCKL